MIVKNSHGVSVDFDAAVNLMDDEIREALHAEGIESEQSFFAAYALEHSKKYGETWELDKPNPCY